MKPQINLRSAFFCVCFAGILLDLALLNVGQLILAVILGSLIYTIFQAFASHFKKIKEDSIRGD